ncbi:MAG: glycerophosphodiester phosphodiesterase family protein [Alphaproteobacteria bacterium]
MSPAIVAKARRHGRKLAVYVVNETPEATAFLAQGVDSLFSDRPDLLDDHDGPQERA